MAHPSQSPTASLPRSSTDAGTPVGLRDAHHETSSPVTEQALPCPSLAFYLQEATEGAPARRRCLMIAGAAAGTEVLQLAVLPAACGPLPEDPKTDTLPILSSGPLAHRRPVLWLRPPTPRQRPVRGSGISRPRARR